MSRVKWKNRKSRLAQRVSKWFKENRDEDLSFGAILDKYVEEGMSRRYVANLLMNITGKDDKRLGDEIKIKDTSLWEAWQAERAQGRCEFQFHSKFPGNFYHGNRNLPRKKAVHRDLRMTGEVQVEYACDHCTHTHSASAQTTGEPRFIIALKAHKCPGCGRFGTCVGKFEIDEETVHKAVVAGAERFVKSKGSKLVPYERSVPQHG